jgi:hypothetical protein
VCSVDNFGLLGESPSHPELLDNHFLSLPGPNDPVAAWAQAIQALMATGEMRTIY